MKRVLVIAAMALVIAAVPALAGEDCSSSEAQAQTASDTNQCSYTAQECLNAMVEHFRSRGWVGIELESASSGDLTITKVEADSPANAAGLREGDVLLAMNGIRFSEENKEAMKGAQEKMTIGATITYTVDRSGKDMDVDVTLKQIPDTVMAKWIGRHMIDHASVDVAQN